MKKPPKIKMPPLAKLARQQQTQAAAKNPFSKDFVKPGSKAMTGDAPKRKKR